LSILSFGIYETYWFYRNWRAIKIQQNVNLSPFWRACFSVIFAYRMFKDILSTATELGYKEIYSPGFLAIGYWAFCALSRASGYWALLSLASFFVFIPVQKAAVFNNQQLGVSVEKSGLCRGEILSLIIGWVVVILMSIAQK